MEKERSLTVHYLIRALIMGGFSFYIVHLNKGGKLAHYLAPRMELYVKMAAIGLFVIAACQLYMAIKSIFAKSESCGCAHEPPRSIWRNGIVYGLFLLPLLLGFILPDAVLGSDIADTKGVKLSPDSRLAANKPSESIPNETAQADSTADGGFDASAIDDATLDRMFPPEKYMEDFAKFGKRIYKEDVIEIKELGFMERLTAIDMYKDNFVGRKVKIVGFVYREDDMASDQFIVSRLAMQCCSADASPYGVVVRTPNASKYMKNMWVSIVGKLGKTIYNDNEIIQLEASSIKVIPAPDSPYIYPYLDDFDKLP